MSDFDELLSYDPLGAAEAETGKSYKEDRETANIGLYLALAHSAELELELGLRDDTYYGIPFADYTRIVEEEGFTLLLENLFGEDESYRIYWREGLLLTCESYGTALNSATVYFNADFTGRGDPFSLPLSGHYNRDLYDAVPRREVWVGSMDGVTGLRHSLAKLADASTILPQWVEEPHLWLLNYEESRLFSSEASHLTEEKLSHLPPSVRSAITARL